MRSDRNSSGLLARMQHIRQVDLLHIHPSRLMKAENRHLCFPIPSCPVYPLRRHEITEATGSYCATSDKIYFAHIWITVLTALTTV